MLSIQTSECRYHTRESLGHSDGMSNRLLLLGVKKMSLHVRMNPFFKLSFQYRFQAVASPDHLAEARLLPPAQLFFIT